MQRFLITKRPLALRWIFLAFCVALSFSFQVYAQNTPTATAAPDTPMRFYQAHSGGNCRDCVFIGAVGRITAETAEEFRRFMGGPPTPERSGWTVYLHSPGGSLIGGMELGRQFRAYRVNTAVGHSVRLSDLNGPPWEFARGAECLSACVFAFAGGARRFFGPDEAGAPSWVKTSNHQQILGVHQFYRALQQRGITPDPNSPQRSAETYDTGLSDAQRINGLLVTYLVSMGVDSRLLDLSARVAPETVSPLTRREAYDLDLANDPLPQPPWRMATSAGGLVLRTTMPLNQNTLNADILCDPANRAGLTARLLLDTDMRYLAPTGGVSAVNEVLRKNYWGIQWVVLPRTQEPQRLAAEAREFRWDGSRIIIQATLPEPVLRHLSAGGKVQLWVDTPGFVNRGFPWIQFSAPEIRDAQDLLLRNCPMR
jgi:hypothetical protein